MLVSVTSIHASWSLSYKIRSTVDPHEWACMRTGILRMMQGVRHWTEHCFRVSTPGILTLPCCQALAALGQQVRLAQNSKWALNQCPPVAQLPSEARMRDRAERNVTEVAGTGSRARSRRCRSVQIALQRSGAWLRIDAAEVLELSPAVWIRDTDSGTVLTCYYDSAVDERRMCWCH
ncbi:hypothetical protein SVAN01_05181 [Stagonosporopsis vannaccii]|nr:hypothetical protein SVAN01_05181 [Stagonosporopsis vannaccii]